MLNLVLFGPPGAGKGTQSAKLIDKYNLVHLSTGDIFRYNIKGETELGILAKSFIDKGELVPDEVTISMLESEVKSHPEAKGFIFDGFPRTEAQAGALDKFLTANNTAITCMLALTDIPQDELITRILGRAKDSGRADDANEETIKNRLNVYEKETAIVANFYQKQNKFIGINGVGEIDTIFSSIYSKIDEVSKS